MSPIKQTTIEPYAKDARTFQFVGGVENGFNLKLTQQVNATQTRYGNVAARGLATFGSILGRGRHLQSRVPLGTRGKHGRPFDRREDRPQ